MVLAVMAFALIITALSYTFSYKIGLRFFSGMFLIAVSALLFGNMLYIGWKDTGVSPHTVEIGDAGTYGRQQIAFMFGFFGGTQILYAGMLMIKMGSDSQGKDIQLDKYQ